MIDYEDVEIVALSGDGGGCGGPVGALLFVAMVLIILGVAMCNDNECGQKHCANGSRPRLMNHSCLCVDEAR